jgi:hypothetical protein
MISEPKRISFDFLPEDLKAWWLFNSQRPRSTRLIPWFGAVGLALVGMVGGNHYALTLETVLLLGAIAVAVGYFGMKRLMIAGVEASAAGLLKTKASATQFGTYRLSVDAAGISEEAPNGAHTHKWEAIEDLCETTTHFFLIVAGSSAYVVPKRAFVSGSEAAAFWTEAHSLWNRAAAATAPPHNEYLDSSSQAR